MLSDLDDVADDVDSPDLAEKGTRERTECDLEIENRMADVLESLGRIDEADEIRRRIKAVE